MLQDIINWIKSHGASDLITHSQQARPGCVFVALGSSNTHQNIQQAIDNGARAVLHDKNIDCRCQVSSMPVADLNKLAPAIFAEFYDNPSRKLNTVAVTGTNGKSSICFGLAKLHKVINNDLTKNKCAVIGTIGWGDIDNLQPCALTTPDNATLQRYLFSLHKQAFQAVALEASSHALAQNRLQNIAIDIAIFTRLSRDHLDYHNSMDEYFAAKAKLLNNKPQVVIINAACPYAAKLQHKNIISYSLGPTSLPYPCAELRNISAHKNGFRAELISPWGNTTFDCPLLGEFNLENCLAMLCALATQNNSLTAITAAIAKLSAAPGRLEVFNMPHNKTVVVDYAHTPDALEKALQALRLHFPDQKIHCVFGCGGDRDQGKRRLMGRAAELYADNIILTNDNPRSEDPNKIIADILSGITSQDNVSVIPERKVAIQETVGKAAESAIILVAGKGHETTQTIGNKVFEFSDRDYIRSLQNTAKI